MLYIVNLIIIALYTIFFFIVTFGFKYAGYVELREYKYKERLVHFNYLLLFPSLVFAGLLIVFTFYSFTDIAKYVLYAGYVVFALTQLYWLRHAFLLLVAVIGKFFILIGGALLKLIKFTKRVNYDFQVRLPIRIMYDNKKQRIVKVFSLSLIEKYFAHSSLSNYNTLLTKRAIAKYLKDVYGFSVAIAEYPNSTRAFDGIDMGTPIRDEHCSMKDGIRKLFIYVYEMNKRTMAILPLSNECVESLLKNYEGIHETNIKDLGYTWYAIEFTSDWDIEYAFRLIDDSKRIVDGEATVNIYGSTIDNDDVNKVLEGLLVLNEEKDEDDNYDEELDNDMFLDDYNVTKFENGGKDPNEIYVTPSAFEYIPPENRTDSIIVQEEPSINVQRVNREEHIEQKPVQEVKPQVVEPRVQEVVRPQVIQEVKPQVQVVQEVVRPQVIQEVKPQVVEPRVQVVQEVQPQVVVETPVQVVKEVQPQTVQEEVKPIVKSTEEYRKVIIEKTEVVESRPQVVETTIKETKEVRVEPIQEATPVLKPTEEVRTVVIETKEVVETKPQVTEVVQETPAIMPEIEEIDFKEGISLKTLIALGEKVKNGTNLTKKDIASKLKSLYGDTIESKERPDYPENKEGEYSLPLSDTHFVVKGNKKACFMYVFRCPETLLFLLKMGPDYGDKLIDRKSKVYKSLYPVTKEPVWYSLIVDQNFTDNEIFTLIDDVKVINEGKNRTPNF